MTDRPPDSRIREGLTFDDVLLVPAASQVLPRDVDLRTRLTESITLHIPLVSAAMDTVTEHETAICLARSGGIGIVHRNMTIARQAAEVDKVKRSESGMIVDPITMSPGQRIYEALEVMQRYRISGVPITREGKAVGILTNRDLRFVKDTSAEISTVMTREGLVTVPPGTTMERARELLHKHRIEKLLVVDAAGDLRGPHHDQGHREERAFPACVEGRDGPAALRRGPRRGARPHGTRRRPWWTRASTSWSWTPPTATRATCSTRWRQLRHSFPDLPIIGGQRRDRRGRRGADRGRRRRR